MKYTYIIILLIILFSCNQNNNKILEKENEKALLPNVLNEKDSFNIERQREIVQDVIIKNISSDPPIIIDTIVQNFNISYSIKDNENVISQVIVDGFGKKDTLYYADRSLCITLRDENNEVLVNKKFDKKDFSKIIPTEEQKDLRITFFKIKGVDSLGCVFLLTICEPDTDVCYFINLSISNTGKITIEEEEEIKE